MSAHAPIVLDIAGTTLTADDRRRLKHPLTGGLILFARNYENRAQLRALCDAIHAARPGLLIAVDHEERHPGAAELTPGRSAPWAFSFTATGFRQHGSPCGRARFPGPRPTAAKGLLASKPPR